MKPHILFIDDEAPIRELLSLYFRKKGLEVTTAMTKEQGRELAMQLPISLVVLDVNLAGENGLELLGYFRTSHPAVPVIVFTGLSGQDLVEKAMGSGAAGFMSKGDSLETLYNTVCQHLPH